MFIMFKWIGRNVAAVILVITLLIQPAYSVGPGLYLGLMTGPATNNSGNQRAQVQGPPPGTTVVAKPKSNQWGSRAFLGYQISHWFGVEGGVTYFSGIHYVTANNVQLCSGPVARVRTLDLVGKGSLPFRDWFDIFAKAGVAVVYQTTSGTLNANINAACGKSQYITKFSPTFSLGASYDITQSWLVDFTWTHIVTGGIAKSVDFYAFGFAYHFVDRYCGQFLCDD